MKEQKSVKTLKGQLFGAVAMMLVASIALGTSTYAWFINNQAVEVENMKLTVSTSTSMTVAVGKRASIAAPETAENWTGYKTVITNDDITGATGDDAADWANMLTNPMTPASVTDASLVKALAGAATGAPDFFYSLDTVENSKLTTFAAMGVANGTDDGTKAKELGEGYAKMIPLRFLSSSDTSVYFGQKELTDLANLVTPNHVKTQAEITAMGNGNEKTAAQAVFNEETAQAAAIQKALRVAIVPRNDATYTGGAQTAFQFDDGAAHIVGSVNNTLYPTSGDGTPVTPNETTGIYRAIATVSAPENETEGKILTTGQLKAELPTAAGTGCLATVDGTTGAVTAPGTSAKALFDLKAGAPRDVLVFIWLEGTDMDCVSTLSAYAFDLVLPFAAPTPAAA